MTELEWSWGRLQEVKLQDRSVSQLQQYMDELGGCAYRYFLSRVVKAWDVPAAWLPQGLGVHEAAEYWERSDRKASRDEVLEVYRQSYRTHTARLVEDTPNFNHWNTGWSLPGWDDVVRRAKIGEEQTGRYLDYYEKHSDERIWTAPDGTKAIELEFHMQLDQVKVMGYIDQVIEFFNRVPLHLRLRDIKTGKKPGGTLQLKVYDLAIEDCFDTEIGEGDYWMGGPGKPTKQPYDLTLMSRGQVVDLFGRLDQGIKQEDFEPSPDPDKCRMCGVRSACIYKEG